MEKNFKEDVINLYKQGYRPVKITEKLAKEYNIDDRLPRCRAFILFNTRVRTCISRWKKDEQLEYEKFSNKCNSAVINSFMYENKCLKDKNALLKETNKKLYEWNKHLKMQRQTLMHECGATLNDGVLSIPLKHEYKSIRVNRLKARVKDLRKEVKSLKRQNKITFKMVHDRLYYEVLQLSGDLNVAKAALAEQPKLIIDEIKYNISAFLSSGEPVTEESFGEFLDNLLDSYQDVTTSKTVMEENNNEESTN